MSGERTDHPPSFREAAELLYRRMLTREALEEAARSEHIDAELFLLRTWLNETTEREPGNVTLIRGLIGDIVKAAAVKYRLSPRKAGELEASMARLYEHLHAQMEAAEEV
jgi:hypothetical protein